MSIRISSASKELQGHKPPFSPYLKGTTQSQTTRRPSSPKRWVLHASFTSQDKPIRANKISGSSTVLSSFAASAHKFATDIRLLCPPQRDRRALRRKTGRLLCHALQAQSDAQRKDLRPCPLPPLPQRKPPLHRSDPVARAHPRRLRQPPALSPRSLPHR